MTSTSRSLSTLVGRARSILISQTGQSNPAIDALAAALGAMSYGQYGYQDNLFRQMHPETCDEKWLALYAHRYKVDRYLPQFASGPVKFTALGSAVPVPLGTRIVGPSGLEYETVESKLSSEPIAVIALDTGVAGNLPEGVRLTLSQGIAGLDPESVESLGIVGGAELEDLEHWRMRVVEKYSQSVSIGKISDYEAWVRASHPDIDFAWAWDNSPKLGMVEIYAGQRCPDPVLPPAVIDEAQSYVDHNRLAGCHPVVKAPTPKPVRVVIKNVSDEVVRREIITALEIFFQSKMGARDEDGNLQSLSPTEIVLTVATVTSNYIVVEPRDESRLARHEVHVLGEVAWT